MNQSTINAIAIISITISSCLVTPVSANGAFTFHRNGIINQQRSISSGDSNPTTSISNPNHGHYQYIVQQQKEKRESTQTTSLPSPLLASFNPLPDEFKNIQYPAFPKNLFKKNNFIPATFLNLAMSDDSSSNSSNTKNDDPTNLKEDSKTPSVSTMEADIGINGSLHATVTVSAEHNDDLKNVAVDPNPFLTATHYSNGSSNTGSDADDGDLTYKNGTLQPNGSNGEDINEEEDDEEQPSVTRGEHVIFDENDEEIESENELGENEDSAAMLEANGEIDEINEDIDVEFDEEKLEYEEEGEEYEFVAEEEEDDRKEELQIEYVDDEITIEQSFEREQSKIGRQMEGIVGPIFGPEIERGVSQDTIKGALVAGVALTFLSHNFNPNAAALVGLWTAYIAITPGRPGNIARVFGDAAWETSKTLFKATKSLANVFNIKMPFIGKQDIQLGDDIAFLVQEVEETVAEVENVLSNSNDARDAAAEEERMIEEAERLAEQTRLLELEYLLEEAKIEKEAYEAEMDFLSAEAQIAEEKKLQEEATLAEEQRKAEEETRIAEEARIAEEQRKSEEEIRIAEEARIAEEQSKADEEARIAEEELADERRKAEEEMLLAEEARLAEKELFDVDDSTERISTETGDQEITALDTNEDEFIDEFDWEASIQLAESLEQTQDHDYKDEWNAARQLANDLSDDLDENELDYDAPGLTEEQRMEKLAQALRAAVDRSEAERQEEEDMIEQEHQRMNAMKLELQRADILEVSNSIEGTNRFDASIMDDSQVETPKDYETMTVKELKEILRSQGLKVSGRKAELIERLRSN